MHKIRTRITELFDIRYPVIQGGMIWCAGWELASAVSMAGGLGLIGSGSMTPDILRHHIRKTRKATNAPFGVNIPLIYQHAAGNIEVVLKEKIPVVFTSAGNPAQWTRQMKDAGIRVVHVVSTLRFAEKAATAGVDAIVAEGFEAGGHNGREETTTMVLVPWIRKHLSLPLIAAGGIASGETMLAALALGADGVQLGSRFAISAEASCHPDFKKAVILAGEGATRLAMKQLMPVRLLENSFSQRIASLEEAGAGTEALKNMLGKGRAKKGMFDGDLEEGELEIGQVAVQIDDIKPVAVIMKRITDEFLTALNRISNLKDHFQI
ncbi:MAG: nitronate monooxygenase [Chlorobi bacterium]|nr:nitronate monooxygenase [Chlorobiota bacterium]